MSTSSPGLSHLNDHSGTQSPAPSGTGSNNHRTFGESSDDRLHNMSSTQVPDESLLMTPRTNMMQSSKALAEATPAEIRTEIRKPTLRDDSSVRRSPSVASIAQQVSSPYPLTFANSISAGATESSANAGDVQSNGHTQGDSDESRVSAYARLDFESFTFYVQTLQVLLGRRAENGTGMVDVHLGPAKAISRKHAKIFYNFGTQRFELSVLGRNGAFVSDVFVEAGSTIPLKDGTKVQIGQIPFTFVLPSVPAGDYDPSSSSGQPITNPVDAITFKGHQQTASRSTSPAIKRSSVASELDTKDSIMNDLDMDLDNLPNLNPANMDSASVDMSLTSTNLFENLASPASQKTERKKKIKKEYKPEEIPPEFREKPPFSYSHLIATALRAHAPPTGISLSDIYKAIQDVFPYYKYCPPGWQNSVRHNLSSSKAFRKVSKEGKGWLWGIDEEYMAEKERQKKKAAAAKAKSMAAAAAAAAVANGSDGHHDFRVSSLQAANDSTANSLGSLDTGAPNDINGGLSSSAALNQRKEREKTIAELAREIEVQRRGAGAHYKTDYASMTRESLSALKRDGSSSSQSNSPHPGVLGVSALKRASFSGTRDSIDSASGSSAPVTPSPNSIQAQLAANLSNRPRYTGTPGTSGQNNSTLPTSDAPIQATSTTTTAPPPQSASGKGAVNIGGLNLSKDTLKALAVLQQKIQSQLGANSNINANHLTNALAIAIAQVAKTGGPNAVAALLNGKNPTQLAQVLQQALSSVRKGKGTGSTNNPGSASAPSSQSPQPQPHQAASSSATPQPQPASLGAPAMAQSSSNTPQPQPAPASTTTSIKDMLAAARTSPSASVGSLDTRSVMQASNNAASTAPVSAPSEAPATSSLPMASHPTTAQSASAQSALFKSVSGGVPTSAATIAEVLAQAKKIANPSPSMLAAIEQLKAHARKLEMENGVGSKRKSDEPLESIDGQQLKSMKEA